MTTQGRPSGQSSSPDYPAEGSAAPEFNLPDPVSGGTVRLSSLRGQDVLLTFFRGTWCPFCRDQMQILSVASDTLRAAGIFPIGIVCQSPATVRRYLLGEPVGFPLLVDENREVARAYNVYYRLSMEGFHLARPSLFIIDRVGRITFAYRGKSMRDLPVAAVLERFIALVEPRDRPTGSAANAPDDDSGSAEVNGGSAC
jgi:peroxiredoxin Q/BCP